MNFSQRYARRLFGRSSPVRHRARSGHEEPTELLTHVAGQGDVIFHGRFEDPANRAETEPRGVGSDNRSLGELSTTLGVSVAPEILIRALTHHSYAEAHSVPDNEPLMSLGDSVLGLVATETIYRNHPDLTKGELPHLRARMVNTRTLARIARGIELGRYIRLSAGEEAAGGRDSSSILADVLEAVVGAVCADQGLDAAAGLVHRLFDPLVELAGANGDLTSAQTTRADHSSESTTQTTAGHDADET